jgi:hypothetical protein
MLVIKLYRKPDKPEFFIYVKRLGDEILLIYPIELPERKRHARWLNLNEVYIDWIREFV